MKHIFILLFLCGCPPSPSPTPSPGSGGSGSGSATIISTQVTVTTKQASNQVYFSFGSDSQLQAADWKDFCTVTSALTCNFTLTGSKALPNPQGKYLNATLAFDAAVGCGNTKAELNINNPNWYDTLDVSLVDGYSDKIEINYTPPGGAAVKLGPPVGKTGNEKVFGVFPYGCDICVARQNPSCGISKGSDGCKTGTQYKPDVLCQVQGAVKGGGGSAEVIVN